ncbi:LON peptidase substrate-binding domain-containing protein [Marinigracilibium pacificum]|uniref:Peptidase n=1 Tax=Marinigracilibium pacificum TaxID=2729599 RepID=A0A848J294_9BACT|nr:LON peptidase substrate-binding domain-containing protein [Marinigracilibium pacificum]NMM49625.1 peptidase [Marinigracilibium pacificum]
MKNFLPLFPLKMVAFPGEPINLHVFESRYKQLVNECIQTDQPFGIPGYVTGVIEYGIEVRIEELSHTYSDGRMDIKTRGERVFKVENYKNPWPGKLYAGGEVVYLDNVYDSVDSIVKDRYYSLINELFELLNLKTIDPALEQISSYDLAHKVGLSISQEYELLKLTRESERKMFIVDHLEHTLPVIKEYERSRTVIKMNGHFKHLKPPRF